MPSTTNKSLPPVKCPCSSECKKGNTCDKYEEIFMKKLLKITREMQATCKNHQRNT